MKSHSFGNIVFITFTFGSIVCLQIYFSVCNKNTYSKANTQEEMPPFSSLNGDLIITELLLIKSVSVGFLIHFSVKDSVN